MEMLAKTDKRVGKSFPLGATVYPDGVNFSVFSKNVHWEMIRETMKSVANLSIFPVQDILGLDRKARTNVPGKATGNWQWRMEQKSLTKKLAMQLSTETQTFNRLS